MTPEIESLAQQLIEAAERANWMQVALNCAYGPPCFHFQPVYGTFCLHAKSWPGHDCDLHPYLSFGGLIRGFREELAEYVEALEGQRQTSIVLKEKNNRLEDELKQARRDALVEIAELYEAECENGCEDIQSCDVAANIRALMEKPE